MVQMNNWLTVKHTFVCLREKDFVWHRKRTRLSANKHLEGKKKKGRERKRKNLGGRRGRRTQCTLNERSGRFLVLNTVRVYHFVIIHAYSQSRLGMFVLLKVLEFLVNAGYRFLSLLTLESWYSRIWLLLNFRHLKYTTSCKFSYRPLICVTRVLSHSIL